MKGFFGKLLWINLSRETFEEQQLSDIMYKQYLGGYGLACRIIYENLPFKTDPLNSNAILGLFSGLLTGTIAPLSGRYMVAGKSPLTSSWGDANCGGFFGREIKRCGYDGLLITGISRSPKCVIIDNQNKDIIDASDLWGLDTIETELSLKKKYGNGQIASIGQAGENLSLISGIVTDRGRIAARCGFGALMGSKKLKAIFLKCNQKISVDNDSLLLELTKKYNKTVKDSESKAIYLWKNLGTSWMNVAAAKSGDTPIKNWKGTHEKDFQSEKLEKISGIEINKYKLRNYGCFSCSVQCGGIVKVPAVGIEESHIPEYETCASFGPLLLNDDLNALFVLNDLCNRAGIDTISAGGTIAFAIECFENGLISAKDTEGLTLKWGNSKETIELLKKIITRKGIGDILADGTKKASERIGKGSEKFAIHARGQELAMHSPKFYKSLAVDYAFDPSPGKHNSGSFDLISKGCLSEPNGYIDGLKLPNNRFKAIKLVSSLWQTTSCLGLCQFTYSFQKYPLLEAIRAVTGWELNIDELLRIGHRIQTLRQSFALKEGINIVESKLPERAVDFDYKANYKEFCKQMGWNPETGIPLKKTLKELELDFVIKDFY